MKKIIAILILLIVGMTLFSGCSSNTVIDNQIELNNNNQENNVAEDNSDNENGVNLNINEELIKKINLIDLDENYIVNFSGASGKHSFFKLDQLYEIKNEQILFLNSSSSFSYTKNLTYIKKICNEIYSIKLNNCDCKEYDVNNANNLISSYECNLNDKVNIDELKTKSILLESLKNEIPNWKIELDEDENCFHNKVETFNREKICFKNNDIIYYSIDKSELGFISFKEWKFN